MEPKVLLEVEVEPGCALRVRVRKSGGTVVETTSETSPEWYAVPTPGGQFCIPHALLKLARERDDAFRAVDAVRGDAVRLGRERELQIRLRRELAAAREEIARLEREVKGAEQGRDRWRRLYDGLTLEWAKQKAELDARLEEVARGSLTIDDVADALTEHGIEATVDLVPRGRYLEIRQNGALNRGSSAFSAAGATSLAPPGSAS